VAAVCAKEVLSGQHVVVVRTEAINISGSLFRNKLKYAVFRRKHVNTNPRRGPFHPRAPAKIFFRTVRGMIPHKTKKGMAALGRLKTFEGCPPPYDRAKRQVVPDALKAIRLRPGRKFCVLGELAEQVGWKYSEVVSKLEDKRKTRSSAYYLRKKALNKVKVQAASDSQAKLTKITPVLVEHGFQV